MLCVLTMVWLTVLVLLVIDADIAVVAVGDAVVGVDGCCGACRVIK